VKLYFLDKQKRNGCEAPVSYYKLLIAPLLICSSQIGEAGRTDAHKGGAYELLGSSLLIIGFG
jgi:hypothetical protein